jgi:hypothetical protein
MHFAQRKVMELEAQLRRDIRVGVLLVRQGNVQGHRRCTRFFGTPIGGFHDAGATACANEQSLIFGQICARLGYQVRKDPGIFIMVCIA